jgi:hypothetical protein
MIKLLIKLVIAGLIANAAWRVGSAYASFYRFKDSVHETALYAKGKSDLELRQRVLELASTYDAPVNEEAIEVRRESDHILINTSYTKPVDVLPGVEYQWPFTLNVDVLVLNGIKALDSSGPPK